MATIPSVASPQQVGAHSAGIPIASDRYFVHSLVFEASSTSFQSPESFTARARGFTASFSGSGAALSLNSGRESTDAATSRRHPGLIESPSASIKVSRILLKNASGNPGLSGDEELPGKVNYLLGKDPTQWKTNIPTYARVRYSGVYPGIDLVYYGTQDQLEFDFDVAPDANPRRIELQFDGAHKLSLDRRGNLKILVGDSSIQLHKPVIYQQRDGRREPIAGSFRLLDRHTVGFILGHYDHARSLVIDPILTYSTYLGLPEFGSANAVAVDGAGNAYVTGMYTTGFPVTAGAYQTANASQEVGGSNAFVTKFDPNGNVIYSTYLGGSMQDGGNAIAVDAAGNAYVAGYTASPDFPVTSGAYQTTDKVTNQPSFRQFTTFVTKLNPSGSGLVYSTFLGGSKCDCSAPFTQGQEQATSIGLDSSGNAWIAGFTFSTDFPTTPNAVQTANPEASQQAFANFLTKLNSSGSALDYSTYLGSANSSPSLAVDAAGNVYIAGDTANSATFPTTPGAYLSSSSGLDVDSFIAKFSSAGGAPVYSTLVGGTGGGSWFKAIAVDSAGNAYVTGGQNGGIPTTPGVIGPNGGGALTLKMNPTGTALVYSTGLGVSAIGNTIAVDSSGNAYVAGSMGIATFPVTPNAFQTQIYSLENSVYGSFVAKINATATAVDYATYLSGFGANPDNAAFCDCIDGGALDSSGNFIVVGQGVSADFPTTPGAFESASFNTINYVETNFWPFVTKFNGAEMAALPLPKMNLTVNANPQDRLSNVVFTASLTPQPGSGVPTGSVEFSSDDGPLCNVPVDNTGTATCTTTLLTIGDDPVRVSYYGDPNNSAVTQSMTETINGIPTTTTLSSAQTSVMYGGSITFTAGVTANTTSAIPPGIINMPCGSLPVDSTGHATCSTGGTQLPGTYNFAAQYAGDTNYAPSGSNLVTVTIEPLGVAAPSAFSPAGGTYTQTVPVVISDATPNAMIYYTTDGSTPTPSTGLPYGGSIYVNQTETIQAIAVVAGYTNSNVASVTYTLPPTFAMVVSPATLSVTSTQSASTTVSLTSQFGFNGQVSFSCSGLPAGTSCSFSPATVTGNPLGAVTTTMTVSGGSAASTVAETSHWWPPSFLALTFGMFGLTLRRRRYAYLLTAVLSTGLIFLGACSGGGGGAGGGGGNQTPVTSTVTVTGTSGTVQNTATLTVTYTP